jgi:hypothetical protein
MDDMSSDWRDKDDLDLTSEDITAIFDAGEPAEIRGPAVTYVPMGGKIIQSIRTFGGRFLPAATPGLITVRVETVHR